jgi:hypothetical protein
MGDEIKTYVACARSGTPFSPETRQRYDGLKITVEVSCIRGQESVSSVEGRRRETLDFISETEFHWASILLFGGNVKAIAASGRNIDNSRQLFHFFKFPCVSVTEEQKNLLEKAATFSCGGFPCPTIHCTVESRVHSKTICLLWGISSSNEMIG